MGKPQRVAMKLGASVSLLALIAWKLDLRLLAGQLATIPPATAVAGLLVASLPPLVATHRFKRVIQQLGEGAPFGLLLGDTLVGRAFNLLLPTQVGGDVTRALRSGARMNESARAWAAVLYERLIGMLVLTLIPLVCLVALPVELPALAWAATAFVALVVAATLCFLGRLVPRAARLTTSIPPVSRALDTIADALDGRLARWPALLETAAWSGLAQLSSLLPLALVCHAWAVPGSAGALLVGVPTVLILSMAPITLGGFGLRESLFVLVLPLLGVAQEQALALSVVWLLSLLPAAIAGLVVLGLERPRASSEAA